jgi:tetratricopeptide (TPR) repeat protein
LTVPLGLASAVRKLLREEIGAANNDGIIAPGADSRELSKTSQTDTQMTIIARHEAISRRGWIASLRSQLSTEQVLMVQGKLLSRNPSRNAMPTDPARSGFRRLPSIARDRRQFYAQYGGFALPDRQTAMATHDIDSDRQGRSDAEPGAVLEAAVAAQRDGRPEAAVALYRQVLPLFADLAAQHTIGLWLSAALCDADRRDEAVLACSTAIAAAPDRPAGPAMLAGILLDLGRPVEAGAAAEAALALAPEDPGLLNLAGGVALAQGRDELAATHAAACLNRAPADQRALAHLAAALAQRGPSAPLADLLDFEHLLRVTEVAPPPGFASIGAFNQALAAGLSASPRLDRRHIGKTMVGGARLHDCFTLEPRLAQALEALFRREIAAYAAGLAVAPGHPVRRGRPEGAGRLVGWANIMERADYELPHIHDGSWLSGVYYAEMPDGSGDEGAIEFGGHDFGRALRHSGPTRRIRPAPGMMVQFPAYFYHRTIPFAGAGRRISIAFDIRLESDPQIGGQG